MSPSISPDLYHQIIAYIDDQDDLLNLSVVSANWRYESESILWRNTLVIYDDTSEENVQRLDYLNRHAGHFVRYLELDYTVSADITPATEQDSTFLLAKSAIHKMVNVTNVDIYCHGDTAASIFLHSGITFHSLHTIKYAGSCSPSLYQFLHNCPNLTSLRFSYDLEPKQNYSLLLENWGKLTTFSGNILHVAAMLQSELVKISHLTLHLNPNETVKKGFEEVPVVPSVTSFGVGDIHGYTPALMDLILIDIFEALTHFPRITQVKRIPFHPRRDNRNLILSLAQYPLLQYVSLMDCNYEVREDRGIEFGNILRDACPRVDRLVCIPCPPHRFWALDFTLNGPGTWSVKKIETTEESDI